MQWQKNICVQGKSVQVYQYQDVTQITVIKSREDQLCCINSQFILRIFNLKTQQMEKEINISQTMPQDLLRYYRPIYQSELYLYHQSNILNIEKGQQHFIQQNYSLVYVDEQNIYGYKIIQIREYQYDLSVVELNKFGEIIQQIYGQNLQCEHFLIDKYFIIVQQPNHWFRIDLIKKKRKIRFHVKQLKFNFKIYALTNNQFMFLRQFAYHSIRLQEQFKIIRKIQKFPIFDTVCGSFCIKYQNFNKSLIKILYYDYVSLQQGTIMDDLFENKNFTIAENSKNLIFASDNQMNILKFKA